MTLGGAEPRREGACRWRRGHWNARFLAILPYRESPCTGLPLVSIGYSDVRREHDSCSYLSHNRAMDDRCALSASLT